MIRVRGIVVTAGALLAASLLRPSVAEAQASGVKTDMEAVATAPASANPTLDPGLEPAYPVVSTAERALLGKGPGVQISPETDRPIRPWQGTPEEALLGRREQR